MIDLTLGLGRHAASFIVGCALVVSCEPLEEGDATLEPRAGALDEDAKQEPAGEWELVPPDEVVPELVPGAPTPCGVAGSPRVDLHWDALGPNGTGELPSSATTLVVSNRADYPLFVALVEIVGEFGGDPIAVTPDLKNNVLEAEGELTVEVDLAMVVPEFESEMHQSASIEVFAKILDIDGRVVEQAASEPLFFHRTDGGKLEVYDRATLEGSYSAGSLSPVPELSPSNGAIQRVIAVDGIPPKVDEGL